MNWLFDADWMRSPNVKLTVYVWIAILPRLTEDLSNHSVGWNTVVAMALMALTTMKAYMSDPSSLAPPPGPPGA
jgi:hypothetical protein